MMVLFASLSDGITNPCAGSGCSHICMLSGSSDGFTCACPENHVLNSNGLTCESKKTNYKGI